MTLTHSSLDPNLYSEALEQQWALVHDIMSPTGAWLAFVDRPKIAQARAVGRGEQDVAGYVAATIGQAQPFFWRASIARATGDGEGSVDEALGLRLPAETRSASSSVGKDVQRLESCWGSWPAQASGEAS